MEDLKMLQLVYAGALAEAAYFYEREGIIEKVNAEKKSLQDRAAPGQITHWGITSLEETYKFLERLFGCARWKVFQEDHEGKDPQLVAETESCTLCGIAKKRGSGKPCELYCINPLTSYARHFGYELKVEKTLWEEDRCRFVNKKNHGEET